MSSSFDCDCRSFANVRLLDRSWTIILFVERPAGTEFVAFAVKVVVEDSNVSWAFVENVEHCAVVGTFCSSYWPAVVAVVHIDSAGRCSTVTGEKSVIY